MPAQPTALTDSRVAALFGSDANAFVQILNEDFAGLPFQRK